MGVGSRGRRETYLEHLNVRYAEVEVRGIARDERAAEEETDGENRPEEHILGYVNILRTIHEMCCALEDAGAYGLFIADNVTVSCNE